MLMCVRKGYAFTGRKTPDLQKAQCEGKPVYHNWSEALKAIGYCKKAGAARIYTCPFCHKYHIGVDHGKAVNKHPVKPPRVKTVKYIGEEDE